MKINTRVIQKLGIFGLIAMLIGLFGYAINNQQKVYAAAAGDVVINEIMYHPNVLDHQTAEFIELYNTTGSPINLQNWKLYGDNGAINPDDLMLTFGAVTIDPGEYIVISPSSLTTMTTYGVATAATYTSNLSNGGEALGLFDEADGLMDFVEYDDVAPWPVTPDGTGPSLELRDSSSDNTDATSWGASVDTEIGEETPGTPGEENSIVSLTLPEVSNVSDPNDVAASTAVDITAEVTGTVLSTVNLKYIVNFDTEVTVQMLDDGNGADDTASDDIYTATIPGQAIKTLVRFKVEATDGNGTSLSPGANDSLSYHGYYVKDPSLTSNADILHWFIDEDEYQDMYDNANNFMLTQHPAIVIYGNDVFDNVVVRVKGSNTLQALKKSLRFDLPAGYFIIPPDIGHEVKDFHMNANFSAANAARVETSYWVMRQAGLAVPDTQVTQLQRNGEFEGAYLLVDKYQSAWREINGFDDGPMFEDFDQLEAGADDTVPNLSTWRSRMLLDRKSATKRGYILDDNNIPALINYMAVSAIIHHHDYNSHQNIVYYKDNDTMRWQVLPWDHDLDFSMQSSRHMLNVFDNHDTDPENSRFFLNALYEDPELRLAYYRRLSTLVDQFYTNNGMLTKYNELTTLYQDLSTADNLKWDSPQRRTEEMDRYVYNRMTTLYKGYYREPWIVPPSQTQGERESVSIAEISADAVNANEYIRLDNSADTPVDISDWLLDEIDYTIPAGSVIPANGSIYILRDDAGYKASHASVLVAGEFGTDLGGSGTLTLKTDDNDTIDSEGY